MSASCPIPDSRTAAKLALHRQERVRIRLWNPKSRESQLSRMQMPRIARSRPFQSRLIQRQRIDLAEKIHHLAEELHSVLLHDDSVSSFTDFNEPLVWSVRQLCEIRVRLIARQVRVPLGVNKQGWYTDVAGIVLRFTGGPIRAQVLEHAVRCA